MIHYNVLTIFLFDIFNKYFTGVIKCEVYSENFNIVNFKSKLMRIYVRPRINMFPLNIQVGSI